MCPHRARRAFTLIELLVVIAIIALLVSILVPSLQTARELARKALCLTHLKNMGTGVSMYIQDSNDVMPPWYCKYDSGTVWYWAEFIVPYCDSTAKPLSPDSGHTGGTWWTVGFQGTAPNWNGHYSTADPIVYSPTLNCPTQTGKGSSNYNWHYAYTRTWQRNPGATWDVDPTTTKYGKMSNFKNPTRFALICETGQSGCLPDQISTSWYTGNNYLLNWLKGYPIHSGKTRQFCMAGGNVTVMTDDEIMACYPVSKTPNTLNDYPFNIPIN